MAVNREEINTEVIPLADRLATWEEAVAAVQTQISLAKTFQDTGRQIIEKLQKTDVVDGEKMVKLYSQALTAIEKGVAVERDARKELRFLQHHKPRKLN